MNNYIYYIKYLKKMFGNLLYLKKKKKKQTFQHLSILD